MGGNDSHPEHRTPILFESTPVPGLGELDDGGFGERYRPIRRIGTGGMGEVWACHDQRIHRPVAMKLMHATLDRRDADRFVAEARMQAQLEHPAIVPVYDLGVTMDGVAFFTMKRVHGVTLREVFDRLAAGDDEIASKFTRRKLLSAFASVCLTIQYAHEHEILHRDLKPDNVMLGDFGEVYVLDWGIARHNTSPSERAASHDDVMVGTPAYMPPEMRLGRTDMRGDIYSLGAILYELLTLASIRDASPELDATVPPSLLVACRTATAPEPEDRFATARELGAAVEQYLEGDLDLERRRRLAGEHALRAAHAAAEALRDRDASGTRRLALAEAGRALAIDPQHRAGMPTLLRLLTDPPQELPAEALAGWKRSRARSHAIAARAGVAGVVSLVATVPMWLWMGVRWGTAFAALLGLAIMATLYLGAIGRGGRCGRVPVAIAATLVAGVLATSSLVFGPLVSVPGMMAIATSAFIVQAPRLVRPLFAIAVLAIAVPLGLEWYGVLPPSYRFVDGTFVILPRMVAFPPTATIALLITAGLSLLVSSTIFFHRVSRERAQLERRLYMLSWQLRQVLSDDDPTPVPGRE